MSVCMCMCVCVCLYVSILQSQKQGNIDARGTRSQTKAHTKSFVELILPSWLVLIQMNVCKFSLLLMFRWTPFYSYLKSEKAEQNYFCAYVLPSCGCEIKWWNKSNMWPVKLWKARNDRQTTLLISYSSLFYRTHRNKMNKCYLFVISTNVSTSSLICLYSFK